MMRRIRALIVDDEILARERIASLLQHHGLIKVIKECGDGRSALEAIQNLKPDLVFLDVQMPEMDGFQVLEQLGDMPLPMIVFVTAYSQHAIRAFDLQAIDYLLKPFEPERFHHAIDRVSEAFLKGNDSWRWPHLKDLLAELRQPPQFRTKLFVKTKGKRILILLEEVDWIAAAGNYIELNLEGQVYLGRTTLQAFEKELDPQKFVRVHRSTVVNFDRVEELIPKGNGDFWLVLHSNKRLTLSRNYRKNLEERGMLLP